MATSSDYYPAIDCDDFELSSDIRIECANKGARSVQCLRNIKKQWKIPWIRCLKVIKELETE